MLFEKLFFKIILFW